MALEAVKIYFTCGSRDFLLLLSTGLPAESQVPPIRTEQAACWGSRVTINSKRQQQSWGTREPSLFNLLFCWSWCAKFNQQDTPEDSGLFRNPNSEGGHLDDTVATSQLMTGAWIVEHSQIRDSVSILTSPPSVKWVRSELSRGDYEN
jgi:hypothetical protein